MNQILNWIDWNFILSGVKVLESQQLSTLWKNWYGSVQSTYGLRDPYNTVKTSYCRSEEYSSVEMYQRVLPAIVEAQEACDCFNEILNAAAQRNREIEEAEENSQYRNLIQLTAEKSIAVGDHFFSPHQFKEELESRGITYRMKQGLVCELRDDLVMYWWRMRNLQETLSRVNDLPISAREAYQKLNVSFWSPHTVCSALALVRERASRREEALEFVAVLYSSNKVKEANAKLLDYSNGLKLGNAIKDVQTRDGKPYFECQFTEADFSQWDERN